MLNLLYFMIIPIILISMILILSMNVPQVVRIHEGMNLKIIGKLEEKYNKLPYILEQYYIEVINNKKENVPKGILTTSMWYDNYEVIKKEKDNVSYENLVNIIKRLSLACVVLIYLILVSYWGRIMSMELDYQFVYLGSNEGENSGDNNMIFGLDGISLPFVLLTGFIMPIVYISNWSTIDLLDVYYIVIIMMLELFLLIVFLVIDLITFYVFFESILPPLFILIGLYGAAQKFRAGYYLFLYTLLGSLFMLLCFVKMGGDTASTVFTSYSNEGLFNVIQYIVFCVLFFSFAVKTPLIPVHIWLPLAHSDANVSGSIILASVVLKLALYGFIRILIAMFSLGTLALIPFMLGYCTMSLTYASFTTMRQFDLKVLVAYSSVAHMGSTLMGTFSNTLYGLTGSIIFGLAHGFVSPGLFIIAGAILYDRSGSRIINYYRGLANYMPLLGLVFLLLIFGNMGVPLTANFMGEFLSLLGAYQQNIIITSIACTSVVLSAVYSIYLYNRTVTGSISPYLHIIPDLFRKEYYMILPLIVITIILGIYPTLISRDIEFGLSNHLLSNYLYICILFTVYKSKYINRLSN